MYKVIYIYMYVCVYIKLNHSAVHQKLTHYKSNILQQKMKINWAHYLTRHFPKEDIQMAQEKMLNITNHQRDADQSHSEISPHICQSRYYQKDNK